MAASKDNQVVTKGDLKGELKQFGEKLEKQLLLKFDERLEKQLDRRFAKQDQTLEDRFEKQERILTEVLASQKEEIKREIVDELDRRTKRHMEVLVEHVRDEVGGAYQDGLRAAEGKLENHEGRIIVLEAQN